MSLTSTAPASTHAVTFDETTAHAFACPHCLSSSRPILSNRQEGPIKVDITTIPLYCATCEAEWDVEMLTTPFSLPAPHWMPMKSAWTRAQRSAATAAVGQPLPTHRSTAGGQAN
jgi:hypothetical protein